MKLWPWSQFDERDETIARMATATAVAEETAARRSKRMMDLQGRYDALYIQNEKLHRRVANEVNRVVRLTHELAAANESLRNVLFDHKRLTDEVDSRTRVAPHLGPPTEAAQSPEAAPEAASPQLDLYFRGYPFKEASS